MILSKKTFLPNISIKPQDQATIKVHISEACRWFSTHLKGTFDSHPSGD